MPYKLDFLFIAEAFNGVIYKQSPDDTSREGWGSSFTDVSKMKIKKFSLVGKDHMFTVDLIDGHVEVDGRKVYAPHPPPITIPLQLIYYREVQQKTVMEATTVKSGLLDALGIKIEYHPVLKPVLRYFFGWQCNYQGKNHQWIMGVD